MGEKGRFFRRVNSIRLIMEVRVGIVFFKDLNVRRVVGICRVKGFFVLC